MISGWARVSIALTLDMNGWLCFSFNLDRCLHGFPQYSLTPPSTSHGTGSFGLEHPLDLHNEKWLLLYRYCLSTQSELQKNFMCGFSLFSYPTRKICR